jgi:tRNA dimethylallyltransferase
MKHLIVVAGPTAIGKTALAVRLAQAFETEVISADSRQFYREMAIGTAKPTSEEMQGIPHHFIDFLDVETDYNAGTFERNALATLDTLFNTKDVVILTGGSGLYVDAVCKGLDEVPERDEKIRSEWQATFEAEGIEPLQQKLEAIDPEYYAVVDQLNPMRLIRGIEVNLISGQSYLDLRKHEPKKRNFNIIKIALNTDRKLLYKRINLRVDLMIEAGLLEEAQTLHPKKALNALQTVGYRELFDHFEGTTTREEAIAMIKQNTRRFAKRQLTWLRRDDDYVWFERGDDEKVLEFVSSALHV